MLSPTDQMAIDSYVNPSGESITESRFLTTLERIPDDVVRSLAGRQFIFDSSEHCICAWACRVMLGRERGEDASRVMIYHTVVSDTIPAKMVQYFGGTKQEWQSIYIGVVHEPYATPIRAAWNRRISDALLNGIKLEDVTEARSLVTASV